MSAATSETDVHMQVFVLDDFAEQAARHFVGWAKASQQACVHVALTGGHTAEDIYRVLARPDVCDGLSASAIEFYEGDERSVPPSNPQSNWGMAERTFLDAWGVPASNRHRMRAEAEDLDAATREYEAVLYDRLPRHGELPAFDLLLLGMGEDGHIASLFPGTAALAETQRLVMPNEVPKLQTTRLTGTFLLLNAAHAIWVLVSGEKKAGAVRGAIELRDPLLPVTHVMPRGSPLVWLLDRAAASQLSPQLCRPLQPGSHDSDLTAAH